MNLYFNLLADGDLRNNYRLNLVCKTTKDHVNFSDCRLPIVVNGSVTDPIRKREIPFGETITITCDDDFGLIQLGSRVTVTCQETGNFTNVQSPVVCGEVFVNFFV